MGNNVNYCQCKCRNADNEEECSFDKAQKEREYKENDTQKGGTCSAIGNESNYLSGINSVNKIRFKKHNCIVNVPSVINSNRYECNDDDNENEDSKYITNTININNDKEMNSLQLHLNYLPHSLYHTTVLTNWQPCTDIQPILNKYNIVPITPHILNAQPSTRSHYYLSSSSRISSSSSSPSHNKDPFQLDKVVLYSELKKIHIANSNLKSPYNCKYILRFCTLTSTEFAYYQTKEKFITLQNPLKSISYYDMKDAFQFTFKNNEQINNATTEDKNKNKFKTSLHTYKPLHYHFMLVYTTYTHCKEELQYEIFSSENEDIAHRFVSTITYYINSYTNN